MSSLLKLNIKFNAITKAAAVDLSKVIKNNSEMTNLKLTVSDTSLVEVASSCRTLSSIKCIDWNFSLFKMNSKYLASKFCLKDIIFKINIDDELDADDPYSSIERDIKEITHLTFTNCSCAEVFNCIESLLSLQHLDVNSSTIAYDVISNTIQKNIALSHINISNCCWQRSFNKVDCFKTPNSQPIWYIEEELYEPLKMAFVEEKLYEPLKLEFVEKKLCANFPCKVKYVEKKHYNYPTTVEYVEDKLYEDLLFKVEFAVNEEELYDFPHKVENSIYNDSPLEDYMFYEIAKSLSSLQQLEYLNISGNKITYSIACDIATTIHNNRRLQHLDMSNCQAQTTELLIIFESLENLNDLSYLNFSNNYFCFQANDVTGNINCNLPNVVNANEHLNFLLLSTVDESGQLLEKIVQPSKALKYLDISHNAVTDDAANNLSSIIAEHESLQYLNMNGCIISKHGNKCVTKSIANVAHLQYNIESNCYDGIIHAAVFSNFKLFIFLTYDSKALSSCIPFNVVKSMYYINFASQCLTKEVLHSISTAFSTANIKSLTFINCDFEECNILSILQLTKHIKTLKYFILNSFRMSEEALGDIAQTICNNMNISYLDLSDSKLSGSQFSIIAKALSKLSALQYLDISQNEILDEVAFEIAFVIINNTSLEYLNLSNCVLSDIGIQFICNSSARASSLRALNISGNHITTQAAKNIAAALSCYDAKTMSSKTFRSKLFLHKYSVIEYLNISDCSLSVSDLLIVLSALKNIKSLKYLNLGRNEVDENTTHVLGSLIQNNHKLHSLFIPSCDTSGFLLEKIISQCTTLKYLDISCNTINNCAADNLSCFISSRSLQCVNISHCTMVESGNKVLMNTIANVANLQLRVIQDVFLQSIVAAVLSDFVLFIFLLNDECIHSKCESLSAIKPMYYVNLSCITMEVKDCVASAFLMTHIVYLNFNNCDLGEDNAFVMVQAVEHINTLQYLTLKSSRIHKEALDNIVLIILNNTDMKHIDISDCELCGSEVAVIAKAISKLSALQFLDISRNEVTDEAAVEVASVITNNASLQYLNLSGCDIKDFGIHIISDALAQIKTLLSFNISENHITSNTAKDVAPVVSSNIGLQNICFSNCFTEDETFMIVSCIYKQLKTLKHLNLEGNVINDQTAEDLVALLTVNALQYLNISNCNTSDLGMHKILSALEDNEILEYLNLSCNKVNGRLTEDIKSFMKRVCTLQQLHLSNCKLSQFQVMSFVTVALTSPCSVQHLDLSFNCEAEILPIKFNYTQQQQQLIKNDGLCYLNLCCCGLTDKDMCNVLSMLSMCTSLNYLNLGSCTIPGGISVGSVITNNKSLKYLNLSDCALQKDEIIVVAKSLSVATSIECLLLSSNVITYRAAKEISSAIYNIPSLKQLSLSDCELEDLGLCYITNALEQISSLQQLDLSYNIISDKAAVGIASALSSNTSLEYLDMSYCTWPNNGLAIIRMMIDHKKFRMLKEVDFTTL
ncbi:protein NLRC5-like [Dysidea avara]|uniref:protein NLRC5-like n=1 Tax=Dysidea avara TaxID=196820 RepID=UPI00331D7775